MRLLNWDETMLMMFVCFFVFFLKSNRDRPLLPPKTSETERLSQQQQQDMERMKMFVQLRQDLERVRFSDVYSPILCPIIFLLTCLLFFP